MGQIKRGVDSFTVIHADVAKAVHQLKAGKHDCEEESASKQLVNAPCSTYVHPALPTSSMLSRGHAFDDFRNVALPLFLKAS